ncbi:MAG: hypothetical protein ACRCU6_00170 [Fusobacteriaceae bacterium]
MVHIDKNNNIQEAKKMLSGIENGMGKALSRAFNHSISKAKTAVKKKVTENYYIKSGDVEKTIKLKKASISDIEAKLTSKGPVLALNKFKVSTKGGVIKAAVSKLQGYKIREGAFTRRVANFTGSKNGKVTYSETSFKNRVFKRKNQNRMPIVEQSGASIPGMLGNKAIVESTHEMIIKETEKRLFHEVGRMLGGTK